MFSTLSYVVNLFLHLPQSLLRRMFVPSSATLVSETSVSFELQYGQCIINF